MDWVEALQRLPADRIAVVHEPETPRYARARQKLRYVVAHTEFLGSAADPERSACTLVALWAPSPDRRRYGFYCCFRVLGDPSAIAFAALYCFYDGQDVHPDCGLPRPLSPTPNPTALRSR